MKNNIPDYTTLSLAAIPLELYFKETSTCLGNATGFFYVRKNGLYLITNWHVVTGLNPDTKKPIGDHAGIPDMVTIPYVKRLSDIEISWDKAETDLYFQDMKPAWFIHPKHKEKCDVIALRVALHDGYEVYPINNNDALNLKPHFKTAIADEAYVLGFPLGLKQYNFPIWKRASIATEPEIPYEGLPLTLIDTATREGMSGAPVIIRRTRVYHPEYGTSGTVQYFFGIYCGRFLGTHENEAHLGRVWKKEVINEIIDGSLYDDVITKYI